MLQQGYPQFELKLLDSFPILSKKPLKYPTLLANLFDAIIKYWSSDFIGQTLSLKVIRVLTTHHHS